MRHLLAAGDQAFRCLYCSCVWKHLVGQASNIEITPLGFYSLDSNRLQPLPTGFKPYVPKPVKNNRPPGTAVRKFANGRKRSEKNQNLWERGLLLIRASLSTSIYIPCRYFRLD